MPRWAWTSTFLLYFQGSWDDRCIPPHPAYWLRWGGLSFCLAGLELGSLLMSSCDYSWKPHQQGLILVINTIEVSYRARVGRNFQP
jgi:hypothetical protein